VITPGAGNDYVYVGSGNNTIVATVGATSTNEGGGTDTYDLSGTSAAAAVNLGGVAPQATSAHTGSGAATLTP
jgi:hypothetical protein